MSGFGHFSLNKKLLIFILWTCWYIFSMDPEIKTACFNVYVLIMKLDKHLSHIYKGIFIQRRDTSTKIENLIYFYDFI